MRECYKSKNTCKQQLPIVYMSFNNVGHLITSTITTLQHFATLYHSSPNYTSLTEIIAVMGTGAAIFRFTLLTALV